MGGQPERDLTGLRNVVPELKLQVEQYLLSLFVGHMFQVDCTILAGTNALRPIQVADEWCRHALAVTRSGLLRAARVLQVAAFKLEGDGQSTSSSMSSSETGRLGGSVTSATGSGSTALVSFVSRRLVFHWQEGTRTRTGNASCV